MRHLFTISLWVILLLTAAGVHAQHEQDNWYFGHNAAVKFSGTPPGPAVLYDNPMQTRASACISDKVTGNLLFYTNGVNVWNKNHNIMAGGDNISVAQIAGALIVPFPGSNTQYYIFTVDIGGILSYATVDMALNGGLGAVITKNTLLATNIASAFTAVKHAVSNSYWLITHGVGNNSFFSFPITVSGVQPNATESKVGLRGNRFGDLASNHKGNKIAITYYADAPDAIAQVYDFDKFCGRVENAITLYNDGTWDYAYGIAFSPDDTKLYIAYAYIESQVVQYTGTGFANWAIVATDNQNLNHLLVAPDGKMYITTHDNNIPSPIIDVIEYPNNSAPTVGYKKNVLNLGTGRNSYFEFPNFITDTTTPKPSAQHSVSIIETNTCMGDSTKFSIYANYTPDSVRWGFDDPNCPAIENTSTLTNPSHLYSQPGTYWVSISWYRCGLEIFMAKKITIVQPGTISIGADTSFCTGDSLTLAPNTTGTGYKWSTGDTTPTITINKPGTYWLKINNGQCSGADTIKVSQHLPIWVEIGGNFTICDDDNELVKLDAGKGFEHYKWTPTGDTTQWILVNKTGEYFVIVHDAKGCKATDGTKVQRLCDFTFYMPNIFTPNGDGKNDVFAPVYNDIEDFRMEIYNRWGEKLFETTSPALGWNGEHKNLPAPIGAYIWQLSFKGSQNKLLRKYNHKGTVNLLR